MSNITGQTNDFDILETIQSQYGASSHLISLIKNFWQNLNPSSEAQLFYNKVFNIATAEGKGLDIWGRILGYPRSLVKVDRKNKYLGFKPLEGVENDRLGNFDTAVFEETLVSDFVQMNDNMYRHILMLKAFVNISEMTLPDLNWCLEFLYPNKGLIFLHSDTMELKLIIQSQIPESDELQLKTFPFLPVGVNLNIYKAIRPVWGFDGSSMNPFDCGTFAE